MHKTGLKLLATFVFIIPLSLKAAQEIKKSVPVETPYSNAWYNTGWLRLFNQPTKVSTLEITYDVAPGCRMWIGNISFSDGYGVVTTNHHNGKVYVGRKIQDVKFNYLNRSNSRYCDVNLTLVTSEDPAPAGNLISLIRSTSTDFSMLRTEMSLANMEGANYTEAKDSAKDLDLEIENFYESVNKNTTLKEAKEQFQYVNRTFEEFRKVFVRVHAENGKPKKVDSAWLEFQKSYFKLKAVLANARS